MRASKSLECWPKLTQMAAQQAAEGLAKVGMRPAWNDPFTIAGPERLVATHRCSKALVLTRRDDFGCQVVTNVEETHLATSPPLIFTATYCYRYIVTLGKGKGSPEAFETTPGGERYPVSKTFPLKGAFKIQVASFSPDPDPPTSACGSNERY